MDATDILDSRYSWFRLMITLVISLIVSAGMWTIITIMPAVQAEFATDRANAALPYTLTMLGFALGNLLIGHAVDRFGVTGALIGAAILLGVSFGLAAISGSVASLCVIQFFIGFGVAAGFGPLIADISHWFSRRRGLAVAIAACGNYGAGAIWPILLSPLIQAQNWRAAYILLACVTLTAVIPMALLLRRHVPAEAAARAENQSSANRRSINLSPRALQYMLAFAGIACCVAMSMPQVHIVAYCVDLGYGPAIGAEMLSLMLFGGVISRLVSGLLADRFGGIATLLIGSAMQGLALFLYLPAGGMVSLYLVSAVFGLSQGGIVPSYAVIVREYLPAREAGARVGFVMMATILGMALGGWVSGWIYDLSGSYQMAFLNGIAWNILNIAVIFAIISRARKMPSPGFA